MGFARDLIAVAEPAWQAMEAHPFVRGLAAGTLPGACFRRWLCEDWHYLDAYARAVAAAAARAGGSEALRWYAGVLHLTVSGEMPQHLAMAARFGLSRADLEATRPAELTRAYGELLWREANEAGPLRAAVALLPCAVGYCRVAARVQGSRPADERYCDWIRAYADPGYQAAADWLAGEVDCLAAGLGPAELAAAGQVFARGVRLELEFWDMCWLAGADPRPAVPGVSVVPPASTEDAP